MIELRFHHDLYDAAAVEEAVKIYAAHGSVEHAREAEAHVVRVAAGADSGVDDATLAAELANYALGTTITMGPQAAPNPGSAEPAQGERARETEAAQ